MNTVLTRPEIHRQATRLLLERLGIDGYVEYMRDLGLSRGNFTDERRELDGSATIEEILNELKMISDDSKLRGENPV